MFMETFVVGLAGFGIFKSVGGGFYTVKPNERAVITSFGRAERMGNAMVSGEDMSREEQERYRYPVLRVIGPGGSTRNGLRISAWLH
jgi:regulator of protease activity HflC (stomatin/prohibitin superfamily)